VSGLALTVAAVAGGGVRHTALASLAYYGLGFPGRPGWLGRFVALYTLTAYGTDGAHCGSPGSASGCWPSGGWSRSRPASEPRAPSLGVLPGRGVGHERGPGRVRRSRRVIAADALERAERAERTREEEAPARVDAERLRIAREVPRQPVAARHRHHQCAVGRHPHVP
jgi:hypothetical protein